MEPRVRLAHDETLHLRLPASMRAALDGEARAAGVKLSVVTRNALAVGLKAIGTVPLAERAVRISGTGRPTSNAVEAA